MQKKFTSSYLSSSLFLLKSLDWWRNRARPAGVGGNGTLVRKRAQDRSGRFDGKTSREIAQTQKHTSEKRSVAGHTRCCSLKNDHNTNKKTVPYMRKGTVCIALPRHQALLRSDQRFCHSREGAAIPPTTITSKFWNVDQNMAARESSWTRLLYCCAY